jgi:dihydropteroate synthase
MVILRSRFMILKFRGKELELGKRTLIMGILNITPDSFSDGGDNFNIQRAVEYALQMIKDGADIIDIGGESTRPGSEFVSAEEELKRVIPVIKELSKITDIPISIDTYKAVTAERAILAGADIINDIWGLQKDVKMAETAAKYNVPVIAMHNNDGHKYSRDIMEELKLFFDKTFEIAENAGIPKENIILDPGIGFGKIYEQNIEILGRLEELTALGRVLLGTSRKSTLGKILDLPPKERMEGTLATTVIGIQKGVDIVRVHDVFENKRCAMVADAILRK